MHIPKAAEPVSRWQNVYDFYFVLEKELKCEKDPACFQNTQKIASEL